MQWGPIELSDADQGLLVKIWTARVGGEGLNEVTVTAPGSDITELFSRANEIKEISLAFDQNGQPLVAFVEDDGGSWLYWYDPVPAEYTFLELPSGVVNPRITMDDPRTFMNGRNDVILAYVRAGTLHYRQQRDRFTIEYTPTEGVGGPTVSASGLRHISMNSKLRLEFMTDEGDGTEDWTLPEIIADIAARASLGGGAVELEPSGLAEDCSRLYHRKCLRCIR